MSFLPNDDYEEKTATDHSIVGGAWSDEDDRRYARMTMQEIIEETHVIGKEVDQMEKVHIEDFKSRIFAMDESKQREALRKSLSVHFVPYELDQTQPGSKDERYDIVPLASSIVDEWNTAPSQV